MTVFTFDLDDTLMAERDFLRSAYREIASLAAQRCNVPPQECLDTLMKAECGADAFDNLHALLAEKSSSAPLTQKEMVDIYRNHRPFSLPFAPGAESLLEEIKNKGDVIALVTDGRSNTQRAKIKALHLERYIDGDDILISEETGHVKTEPDNFMKLRERHPQASRFVYIADNPAKDFLQPRHLGWTTVAVRDTEGINIHPQDFECAEVYRPDYIVDSFSEIFSTINRK